MDTIVVTIDRWTANQENEVDKIVLDTNLAIVCTTQLSSSLQWRRINCFDVSYVVMSAEEGCDG